MNIIQVCPYDLSIPGGVQTHVMHLSNELVAKNHKVIIFAPSLTNSGFRNKFDTETIHITDSIRIPWWGTSIDISVLSSRQKEKIRKFFREFSPDIIHFHTIWNPVMQTQLLWMVPEGVKKIGTFHDTPPDRGIGKYVGSNMMKVGTHYYLPKLDEVISVSETQTRAMGVDPNNLPPRFRILPNGIDANQGKLMIRTPAPDNEFKMIFIGRFEHRKGVFDLLEMYKRLQGEKLTKEISLTMVGHGPQLAQIQEFISRNNLKRITIYEGASDEIKNQLLGGSDLMVAPALYGESFGIVLLEAMALGVKVIGYGNAGYMNIGAEYGAEHFPRPGDIDALSTLVKKHIEGIYSENNELIERGLDIAAKHDWKLIASEVEKVYVR